MPTMGDTSENASANADRSVKSLTGVCDRSATVACSGAISVMTGSFLGAVSCRARDPVRGLWQDRLRARPRPQVEPGDVPRHLADGGDPEPWQGAHLVDQKLEGTGTRRAARQERMTGEYERCADRMHRLEFERPHLEHFEGALDHAGTDQVRQERVLLPVVEPPERGDLDQ